MDSNAEQEFFENVRLGTDLLDAATQLTNDPEQMERYDKILNMPGVDTALFMIFKSSEGTPTHPKSLLQSAFMLGYFVHDRLGQVEKLWEDGPEDEPSYN
tara:strand:- start:201 stop:500 length:300 start_codon:yes stop_codon:yes gene_type:complete